MNEILIRSINDNISVHEQDFRIATAISSKYGFKLNNHTLNNSEIKWSVKDSFDCEIYTRLGFHKDYGSKNNFFIEPRFYFTGGGGENIRGHPGMPIKNYIKKLIKNYLKIKGYEKEFYISSIKLINRSIIILKKEKLFNNDYEIASSLSSKGTMINHFGKSSLKGFLKNCNSFQLLMDPLLKKINYNITDKLSHDLLAYIYIRFAPDLINIPFEGNKKLNIKSVIKANKLNRIFGPYKIKSDYNKNFYIDYKRKSPILSSSNDYNYRVYLMNIFKSTKIINLINKVYDKENKEIFIWADEYMNKSNHIPLKHYYSIYAISKVLEIIKKRNDNYFNKLYLNKICNK